MFHSHLVYAISIWSNVATSTISTLFKLQKKAIRIITNSRYNAHTEPLFKKLRVLPLPDLISYINLQFMHRFTFNLLPVSFQNTWIYNDRVIGDNELRLRNFNQLQILQLRTATMGHLPLFSLPRMWTNFNENQIKEILAKTLFDKT